MSQSLDFSVPAVSDSSICAPDAITDISRFLKLAAFRQILEIWLKREIWKFGLNAHTCPFLCMVFLVGRKPNRTLETITEPNLAPNRTLKRTKEPNPEPNRTKNDQKPTERNRTSRFGRPLVCPKATGSIHANGLLDAFCPLPRN